MKTALPLRYMESLYEVEIKETPWFKSGLICFGQCAEPGKIIRIKLKYKDSSKKFYNELLRRYKRRFGKPDEWRGDPFQVMIAWKWSFEDRNGNNISMILQHNLQDMEEKIGNVIKISLINGLEKEKRCLEARQGKKELPAGSLLIPLEQIGQDDWDMLLPR